MKHKIKLLIISQIAINRRAVFLGFSSDDECRVMLCNNGATSRQQWVAIIKYFMVKCVS